MLAKVYMLIFLFLSVLTAVLMGTGNVNDLLAAGLGFAFAGLVFLGMIAVLPWWVDKNYSWKY